MKNRRREAVFRLFTFIVVLLLAFGAIFYPPVSGSVRNFFGGVLPIIIMPFHRVGESIDSLRGEIFDRFSAYSQLRALKENEAKLLTSKAEFVMLQNENRALRVALGLSESKKRHIEYAEVIGEFSEERDEYWIINRGTKNSIHEGAAILSPEGVMVGVVRTVSENSATVRLLTSPSESLTVTLLPAMIDALLKGDNNGEYLLSLVPGNIEVHIGDTVVTSGRNQGVPSEIPIGMVVDVLSMNAESFQTVRLKAPAPLPFINKVIVLTDPGALEE